MSGRQRQTQPKRLRLARGEVFKVDFPYVFDPNRNAPIGKWVVVLQQGHLFEWSSVTTVVTVTSQRPRHQYPFHVFVPRSITGRQDSWIDCRCLYTVERDLTDSGSLLFKLPDHVMDEVSLALVEGLCM